MVKFTLDPFVYMYPHVHQHASPSSSSGNKLSIISVDKCYEVHLEKPIDDEQLTKLSEPLDLGDFITQPAQYEVLSDTCIRLVIQEGKFHQVKRMMKAVDNEVVYLKRLRFGPLILDDTLEVGEWRYLTQSETEALYAIK